jgi:hypothetical protein
VDKKKKSPLITQITRKKIQNGFTGTARNVDLQK